MGRILKWLAIALAVIVVIGAGGAAYLVKQFNDQNFVADKTDPDYADRVIPL